MRKSQGRPLLVAFLIILFDLIGFGLIIPVQSFFAETFGASPTWVTWLGASYSLMQFMFAPLWGRLSDRFGRKPILLMSVLASGTGYLLFALADNLVWLFLSRMVAGFGAANIAAAQAVVADVTDETDRARGMGLIGAAIGLGFTVGPAIGGIAGQWGPQAPAWAAFAIAIFNMFVIALLLPETNTSGSSFTQKRWSRDTFRILQKGGTLGSLLLIGFVYWSAFAMMEHIVGLFIEHARLGATSLGDSQTSKHLQQAAAQTAIFLSIVGITSVIFQGGVMRRLSKTFDPARLLFAGLGVVAVSLATLPTLVGSPGMGLFTLSAILIAVGSGLVSPSLSALVSLEAPQGRSGSVLGLSQSASALGRIVGPAMAGILFELGRNYPFFLGATMVSVCLLIASGLNASLKAPSNG